MSPESRIHGLYAITSADLCAGPDLQTRVASAILGGAGIIQYRDKLANPQQQLERARTLRRLCSESGARLIINDDAGLALEVGADGVHIGKADGNLADIRKCIGPEKILGVSCYGSLQRAYHAQESGADYVAFGSVFPSSTKPDAPPATLRLIEEAHRALAVPIVAIGGITLDNAERVVCAGADSVAVISGLFETRDIETTARAFSGLFAHPRETVDPSGLHHR